MSATVLHQLDETDRGLLEQLTQQVLEGLFWGSIWKNDEAEEIARQTLNACRVNLEQHGQPFSWLSQSALVSARLHCVDNAHGLALVTQSGHLVMEDAPDGLTPPANTYKKE